jgi:hypothetical protein
VLHERGDAAGGYWLYDAAYKGSPLVYDFKKVPKDKRIYAGYEPDPVGSYYARHGGVRVIVVGR